MLLASNLCGDRPLRRKSSSRSSGQALITSSAVSQPRCAVPTPYFMLSRWPIECASVSIANFTPASLAFLMCSDGRSSRSGEALTSSAVPVRAQAAASSFRSTSTGGRRPILRVSGWPMMFTYGFSAAAMNLFVIVRRSWSKCEWTDATQMSKPSRKSSSQSTEPSGAMFSSVPCSSVMLDVIVFNCARWASIFSSVIRCMTRLGAWSVTA